MKFTTVFALFFLLPLVYGSWQNFIPDAYKQQIADAQTKYKGYFNMKDMKPDVQSRWGEMKNKFAQGGENVRKSMQEKMEYHNNKAQEMFGIVNDKMNEMLGNLQQNGGEYKEDMEQKKKMVLEKMEFFKEKFEEMLQEFKGNTNSYIKIGHEALAYLNEKMNEYLSDPNAPLDKQLKEFQTMFDTFMEKANQTIQEILEKYQERIEDPVVAARIEKLKAFRDAFMTRSQEGIKVVRQYIKENFSTPEARQAFFDRLNKMLDDIKPQWEQMIENLLNRSNGVIENMFEYYEKTNKEDFQMPTEFREAIEKVQGKVGDMIEKFTSKYEKYMNKDVEPVRGGMKKMSNNRRRRFRGKFPRVEQRQGKQ